jgi:hypothetical protein
MPNKGEPVFSAPLWLTVKRMPVTVPYSVIAVTRNQSGIITGRGNDHGSL